MHIIYCAVCINYGPDRINKKYIGRTRYIYVDTGGQIIRPNRRSLDEDQRTLVKVQNRHLECARIRGNCLHFYNALRRYGNDQFCWGVIDTAETRKEAIKKETGYIVKHKTYKREYGYNLLLNHSDLPDEQGGLSI